MQQRRILFALGPQGASQTEVARKTSGLLDPEHYVSRYFLSAAFMSPGKDMYNSLVVRLAGMIYLLEGWGGGGGWDCC